jgi:hypothetical protein
MESEKGFSGPHLSAAFLCEKILAERDNVPSFIRVIDRFTVHVLPKLPPGIPIPPLPPPVIQAVLVVAFKAGDLKAGKYNLTIKIQKPDGLYGPETSQTIFFNGSEDVGETKGIPIMMPSPEEGLYWFEIWFEAGLVTKVPMRIIHQTIAVQFQQAQGQ